MAVTEQTSRNVSTAAPGATVFPYNFKIFDKHELLVMVDGVIKAVDVDFTVTGAGQDGGGTITFLAPMAGGETVMRRRNMKFERLTDYQNLGDLRSPTLNNDQDAPVMMIQQLDDAVGRALRLADASPDGGGHFDANGNRIHDLAYAESGSEAVPYAQLKDEILTAVTDPNAALFLPLDPGSHQRSIADKLRDRISILDFIPREQHEAIKDGTSTFDCAPAFNAALVTGKKLHVPAGVYHLDSLALNEPPGNVAAVNITAEVSIDVECDPKARFVAGEVATDGAGNPAQMNFFRINRDGALDYTTASDRTFRWVGGYFDGRALTEKYGRGISVGGPGWFDLSRVVPVFENCVFDAGLTTPVVDSDELMRTGTGFMDTAIGTHNCYSETYRNCIFIGFADLGIYVSGDSDGGELKAHARGEEGLVDRCSFYRCRNGVSTKRSFRSFTVLNSRFTDCNSGVFVQNGSGTGNSGRNTKVLNNTFFRIIRNPVSVGGGYGNVVSGNIITNWGRHIADDGASNVSNTAEAIMLASADGSVVSGNTLLMTGAWDDGTQKTGVFLATRLGYPSASSRNVIVDNVLVDVPRPFNEEAGCVDNIFDRNSVFGFTTPSEFSGTIPTATCRQSNKNGLVHIISDGAVSLKGGSHIQIDTEGGASTDDLTTITGGAPGDMITICITSSPRKVTVKHLSGGGNIVCGEDRFLSSVNDTITLTLSTNGDIWRMVSFADNA